ncbi:hypothetical protein V8F20_010625 [Naviculisporaceae sp. PSN 640]
MAAQDSGPAPAARAAPIDETLSSISGTSTTITRFLRSVRAAHSDLAAVTRELSDLRLLLELMRDEQDMPLLLQAQVLALLQDCRGILSRIRDTIERCTTPAQWASSVKQDMTALRQSLEIFRRALGLVLEVVHLFSLPSDAAEIGDIEEQIYDEVDHLRIEAALVEPIDESAMPVLLSYLDAIVNCVRNPSTDNGSSQYSGRSKSIDVQTPVQNEPEPTPTSSEAPSTSGSTTTVATVVEDGLQVAPIEEGLEAVHLDQQPQEADANQKAEISRQFETAGPWHPTKDIVLPFYSPSPHTPAPASPHSNHSSPPQHPAHTSHSSTPPPRPNLSHSHSLSAPPGPSPISPHTRPSPGQYSPQSYSPIPGHAGYSQPNHSPASSLSQQMWNQQMWSPRSMFSITRHNTNNGYFPAPPSSVPETPTSFGSMRRPSTSSSSVYSAHPTPLTPTGHWNPAVSPSPSHLYQPQPTNPLLSSSSSSTSKLSLVDSINHSTGSVRAVFQPYTSPIDIVPTRHLTDKGKPHDVFHIDTSPTSSFIATKHSNNHIKIWSVSKSAVHSNTKITSYVTPQARSREYFIRSHAILSESATLIGITTHFGFNLEIHNFSKSGSSSKKLQTIDEAHRWAASRRDAYQTNYAPLVVYRPKTNQINKFFLSRHPSAKKPFWEDTSQSIDLDRCNLPFVPKFPELAYSANSPFLIAAAGPRPGENTSNLIDNPALANNNPNFNPNNNIILVAWQMTPVSETKLQSRSPVNSSSISTHSGNSGEADNASLFNDAGSSIYPSSTASPDPYSTRPPRPHDRHRPHRFITPSYPPLQNSLPSVLVAHSTTVVSIWIPANHADIPLPGGKFRRTPVSAPERFVLIWDLMTNATRMFGIPNVQACVSPDCRFVAYCDPGRGTGKFVIIDVASGEECWRWPARDGSTPPPKTPWASFGGQMENLSKITVFEFSSDSRMLIVGDATGSLGIYEVKEAGHGPGGRETTKVVVLILDLLTISWVRLWLWLWLGDSRNRGAVRFGIIIPSPAGVKNVVTISARAKPV